MRRLIALSLVVAGCGDGGDADAPDATVDAGPTAADIEFTAVEELPSGAWLLVNDWAATPNTAFVLPVDDLAAAPRVLFTVNRVWSMAARGDGAEIYFAAWDAEQEAHHGITLGDAIQHTFVYAPATRQVRALAWGNLNDECHEPSPDGAYLYVCRRYDFTPEGTFQGWRIGRIRLDDGAFEFLRPDDPGGPFELQAQAIPGSELVLFEERGRPPDTGATILTRDVTTGDEQLVRQSAARPVLAPDGHRVLFQDRTDQSRLKTIDLDAPAAPPVPVSPTTGVGDAAWSPDGATVVYTVYDAARTCDHLEQVTFEGGVWSAPVRVRDCGDTGEFITDLSWVVVP